MQKVQEIKDTARLPCPETGGELDGGAVYVRTRKLYIPHARVFRVCKKYKKLKTQLDYPVQRREESWMAVQCMYAYAHNFI